MVEELAEQLHVDNEVTLAAEKLGRPLGEVDDHKSDESYYYSDFEDDYSNVICNERSPT